MIICDESGRIRAANQRIESLTGHDVTALIGEPLEILVPDHVRARHVGHREGFARTGHPARPMGRDLDINLLRADGTTIPADIALSSLAVGSETLVVAAVRDATQRRSMESVVADRERRLAQLYENAPLVIFGRDLGGVVTDVNPQLCRLTGRETSELIGRDVSDFLPDEPEVMSSLANGLDYIDYETDLDPGGGRPRPVAWHTLALRDATDGLTGALSVGEDLTNRTLQEGLISAMRAVTGAILRGEDPYEIQKMICLHAVRMARASLALVATRTDVETFEVRAVFGDRPERLHGAHLSGPFWVGLDGGSGAAVVLAELEHLEGHIQRDLGPSVLVPLTGDKAAGFLLVADEKGAAPFDQGTSTTLEAFASQVSLSIAYGRRLRALAVADDRDRIARDMHDVVIQRLFAAGLSLQAASLTLDDRPEMSTRLRQVVESLDTAIAELRQSIFQLEQRHVPGLRERVLALVEEVIADLDMESDVDIDEAAEGLPDDKTAHMLATLREALTNAGRHASASRVEIAVLVGSDLALIVKDDGIGLSRDPASSGHGLANMEKRALDLGGRLELSSSPMGGLQLEWRVPL